MKEITFYRTENNQRPVEDFLNSLSVKKVEKVLWVLRLIQELDRIPKQYFKKLISTDDIWEIRIQSGNNNYRLLGFIYKSNLIILTNAFSKKSQKTPKNEIKLAEQRKQEYLKRKNNG
jgi:phage-related protein